MLIRITFLLFIGSVFLSTKYGLHERNTIHFESGLPVLSASVEKDTLPQLFKVRKKAIAVSSSNECDDGNECTIDFYLGGKCYNSPIQGCTNGCEGDKVKDCKGICGGTAVEDCNGTCGGSAKRDCNGDCGGTATRDCNGICGGSAVEDCNGTCGGSAERDCNGDCGGTATRDCKGICGGLAVEDCNGTCGGSAKRDCNGDCGGTATRDCNGICGGSAVEDCNGTCGGSAEKDCNGDCGGAATRDCKGICGGTAVEDCNGTCGGSAVMKECGCDTPKPPGDCDCNGTSTPVCDDCEYLSGCKCYPIINPPDYDGDGTPDCRDRCPGNPAITTWSDCNDGDPCTNDIIGGGCKCLNYQNDNDSDGDNVRDCEDQCPGHDDRNDYDGDGIPDGCDDCPNFDGNCDDGDDCTRDVANFSNCNCDYIPLTNDSDNDSVPDCRDQCPGYDDRIDADNDGISDYCDPCDNRAGQCSDNNPCTINDSYTDNSCTTCIGKPILENIEELLISPATLLCTHDDPIQLMTAFPNGTFSGNGVSQKGIFSPGLAGGGEHIIQYEYRDEGGCILNHSISIEVEEVRTDFGFREILICPGDTAFMAIVGISSNISNPLIEWSGGYRIGDTTTQIQIYATTEPGTYYAYSTYQTCSFVDTFRVIQDEFCGSLGCTDPLAINYNSTATGSDNSCIYCSDLTIEVPGLTYLCEGENFTFAPTSNRSIKSYSWIKADNNQVISTEATMTIVGVSTKVIGEFDHYTLEVTDVNGCTKSVNITIAFIPVPDLFLSVELGKCGDKSIIIIKTDRYLGNALFEVSLDGGDNYSVPDREDDNIYSIPVSANTYSPMVRWLSVSDPLACFDLTLESIIVYPDSLGCANPGCGSPSPDSLIITDFTNVENCPFEKDGKLKIISNGENLEYSIDGENYQLSNVIQNLNPGTYTVYVRNAGTHCTVTGTGTITEDQCTELCNNGIDDDADGLIDCEDDNCLVSEYAINVTHIDTCTGMPSGVITVSVDSDDYEFSIDGHNFQSDTVFTGLEANSYIITGRNTSSGCVFTHRVIIQKLGLCKGCTDSLAHNFDANAQYDEGKCETCDDGKLNGDEKYIDCSGLRCPPCIIACMDSLAYNYNPEANVADSSCLYCDSTILAENSTISCNDGIDNDCDGLIDCADPDCTELLTCDSLCRPQFLRFEFRDGMLHIDPDSHFDIGKVSINSLTIGTREISNSFEYILRLDGISASEVGLNILLNNSDREYTLYNARVENGILCSVLSPKNNEGVLYIRAFDNNLSVWTSEGVLKFLESTEFSGASIRIEFSGYTEFSGTLSLMEEGCPDAIEEDLPFCPKEDCKDGIDNDGDGLIDCDDPDCQKLSNKFSVPDSSCYYCGEIAINLNLPDTICADQEIVISPTVNPGAMYNYQWHNGSNESSLALTFAPGNHSISLLVIDENSCSWQITQTVFAKESPVLTINADALFCPGSAISLTINEKADEGSIVWNTGESGIQIEVNEEGIYRVWATIDGCETSASVIIEYNAETENTNAACSDGLDNDCDGLIDCNDPNCAELLTCDPDCMPQIVSFEYLSGRLHIKSTSHFDIGNISVEGFTLGTRIITSNFEYRLELDDIGLGDAGLNILLLNRGQSISLFNSNSARQSATSCTSIPENTEEGILYIRAVNGTVIVWTAERVSVVLESQDLYGASIRLQMGDILGFTGTLSLVEDGCPDIIDDFPDCNRVEDCTNGRDDDGDGFVDCEDEDCKNIAPCDPDIYCEILSLITIVQKDFNRVNFSFERDGSLDHTLSRLEELGITADETQRIINNFESVRYLLYEDFGLGEEFVYEQEIFLRLSTMNLDFLNWSMNAYTKIPVIQTVEFARSYILLPEIISELTEEECEEIVTILITDDCENGLSISCGGCLRNRFGTTLTTIKAGISNANGSVELMVYDFGEDGFETFSGIESDFEKVFYSEGPFVIVAQDEGACRDFCVVQPVKAEDSPIIEVYEAGDLCISSSELLLYFACGDLENEECINFYSEEFEIDTEDFDELCVSKGGTITITVTNGTEITGGGTITIIFTQEDIDGDGIINTEDLDIDGDGIPNNEDDDVDGDGIPNEEDTDDDGDGVPDPIDCNAQGPVAEICGNDCDDDGDGLEDCEDENCKYSADCDPCSVSFKGKGENKKIFNIELTTSFGTDTLWCDNWTDSTIIKIGELMEENSYSYKWSSGQSDSLLTVRPWTDFGREGTVEYAVTVTNNGDCSTATATISFENIECPCEGDPVVSPMIRPTDQANSLFLGGSFGCTRETQDTTKINCLDSLRVSGRLLNLRHNGLDLLASIGDNIFSSYSGIVHQIQYNHGDLGNNITIVSTVNGITIFSRYNHLTNIYVAIGDSVKQGQVIGTAGITGNAQRSPNPHLHYVIYENSFMNSSRRDPQNYLYTQFNPNFTVYQNVPPCR